MHSLLIHNSSYIWSLLWVSEWYHKFWRFCSKLIVRILQFWVISLIRVNYAFQGRLACVLLVMFSRLLNNLVTYLPKKVKVLFSALFQLCDNHVPTLWQDCCKAKKSYYKTVTILFIVHNLVITLQQPKLGACLISGNCYHLQRWYMYMHVCLSPSYFISTHMKVVLNKFYNFAVHLYGACCDCRGWVCP